MTKKEKAALRASAKFSDNLAFAILEYGALSGQLKSTVEYPKLRDEMLSLLPAYRHPTNDAFAECIFFFDPDGISLSASGYEIPSFIKALEDEGIAGQLITGIKEYVRQSELRKIELAECLELKQKFSDAVRRYANRKAKERIEKRNALLIRDLGLSTKQGRAPKFDSDKMWRDYVTFVRKEGMSPSKAVQAVRKKHGRKSRSSTVEVLNEQRAALLRKIEKLYPDMYDEAKKRLKGFVPTRRND
jgi:hypothetical protein